jgi:hypothetical protein
MEDNLFLVHAEEHHVQDGESIESLAQEANITPGELARFNWGTDDPKMINRFLRTRVGCTKRTKDGKNFIFSSEDDPGLIYIPKPFAEKKYPVNQNQKIQAQRPKILGSIFLQTTNISGYKMGNIRLTLKPLNGGADVIINTNKNGYGHADNVRFGAYLVLYKNGNTFLFVRGNKLRKAIIHTDNAKTSITLIAVSMGTKDEDDAIKYRRLLRETYETPYAQEEESINKTVPDGVQIYCTDNLAIAAGWSGNDKLYFKALKDTIKIDALLKHLKAYFSVREQLIVETGYFVVLFDFSVSKMTIYDDDGNEIKTFNVQKKTSGAIGAYGVFENTAGNVFFDFHNRSYVLEIVDDPDPDHLTSIDHMVFPSDRDSFIDVTNKYKGKYSIVYYVGNASQLRQVARYGGSGFLENYDCDAEDVSSIHDRNMEVCKNVKEAYELYVDAYIKEVKKCEAEEDILRLGHPDSVYTFPMPSVATGPQKVQLGRANDSTAEIRIWIAISQQLDAIFKIISQGSFFFTVKIDADKLFEKKMEYEVGESSSGTIKTTAGVEIKYNFYIDAAGHFVKKREIEYKAAEEWEHEIEGEHGSDEHGSGEHGSESKEGEKKKLEFGVAFETSVSDENWEVEHKVRAKLGVGELELSSGGNAKCEIKVGKLGGAVSEANLHKAQFGFGGFVLVPIGGREVGKLYFMVNFQGIREETVRSFYSKAPGFFRRRTLKDLNSGNVKWPNLRSSERDMLIVLDWKQETWDNITDKDPESSKIAFEKLTEQQQDAARFFGIPSVKWEEFWREFREKKEAKEKKEKKEKEKEGGQGEGNSQEKAE